ncbi:MAG TPA: RHS repeat-associated core domain-containing protein, partial [Polyangiaceae bacterium]|nr:RHS repeat-associated core domain-containing protein [Polyangiaceae bacterium]
MTARAPTRSVRGNPYFHGDNLDSVDTTSANDGTFTRQGFDAFGAPTDPLAATRSGFTGHQHDEDLGLIDMRGRVYDPLAARFLTQDPIRSAPYWTQGQNPYSYVFNDPINATDPSGFVSDSFWRNGADSGTAIEGWGVGVGAAGMGASFGGMVLGGGANVATSFGLNALMGDPFAGSASQTKAGAIGRNVAGVKGGGNGSAGTRQNQPDSAEAMGGKGVRRPSLFDPEAGALACNAGGDVCIEILRQQRAAQEKIIQENIEAVRDAEWELFWAYTGAQAAKLVRWGWVGFKAWRAARAASAAVKSGLRIVEQVDDVVEIAGEVGGHEVRVLANI